MSAEKVPNCEVAHALACMVALCLADLDGHIDTRAVRSAEQAVDVLRRLGLVVGFQLVPEALSSDWVAAKLKGLALPD